jgi:hypothetical protein
VPVSIASSASGCVDARMSSMCERGEPLKSCTVVFAAVISQDLSKPRKKSSSTRGFDNITVVCW